MASRQEEQLLMAAVLLAKQQEEEESATEYEYNEEEYESEIESGIVRFFETITIIGLVMIALFIIGNFFMYIITPGSI